MKNELFALTKITLDKQIVGIIIGGLLVHLLSRSRERARWLLDAEIEEFRELLSALTNAFTMIDRFSQPWIVMSPDEQRGFEEAMAQCYITLSNRIFIADFVRDEDLTKRWNECRALRHNASNDHAGYLAFREEFRAISDLIANRAISRSNGVWTRTLIWFQSKFSSWHQRG